MKKIFLSVLVIVFLVFLSLTAFAMPHRSIFSNSTSTLFFDGALRTANFSVLSVGTHPHGILPPRIARNNGGPDNMTVAFNNLSGTTAGTLSFPGGGAWLGFSGSFMLRQAERVLAAQTMGFGVIRLDNHDSVTYDPATGTFTGSGEVVRFTGTVDMDGVMRSNGDRAMIKLKIYPATAVKMAVSSNGSSVVFGNGTAVSITFGVPALQMNRRLQ
ncbi:MAG: hypothetical protein WA666_13350 [Nitrospirota bacterium]